MASPYRNNVPFVAFTGKFKDLIPDGWTFHKLFANNYRSYHKTCDGEKWSQGCSIWQHHGGYLEIADLFSLSCLFVQPLIENKVADLQSVSRYGNKEIIYWFIIDKKERKLIKHGTPEYDHLNLQKYAYSDSVFASKLTAPLTEPTIDAHYDRYREFNLRPETVVMLQDLLNKGWITVRS